ncbi:MAG: CHAD domain-containing protein, partial [Rubrobacter sp.]|nr:CHAD domain-containing protein [Rubrobacter sp.]
VLGEVRDLDVQLAQLDGWASDASEQDRAPLEELREVLLERRRAARERMLSELDSARYERLVDNLSRMLRRGPSRRNRLARAPVTEAAPELVRHNYRKARKAGDKIGPGSPAEQYHKLRKRGKRLRYLLESLGEVYCKPSRRLVKRIKTLQDVLGEMQDAEVAKSQLRSVAAESEVSAETAFIMGSVAARYEAEAAARREQFAKAYDGIKGKRYKKLEKTMQDMQKTREERAPESVS